MEKAKELSESTTRKVGLHEEKQFRKVADDRPDSPAGVGEQVSREETAVLLDGLPSGLDLPARSHQHSSQVVTSVLGHRADWERSVRGDVEEESTCSL